MKIEKIDGKKRKNSKNKAMSLVESREDCEQIITDVLGSYTGNPYDGTEPIQDVDDLQV